MIPQILKKSVCGIGGGNLTPFLSTCLPENIFCLCSAKYLTIYPMLQTITQRIIKT